jgi:hypothetical protein
MKKLFLSAALFITIAANAQKISKDSLVKLMANEVCIELSKPKDSKSKGKDIATEVGLAMIPVFTNHLTEIQEAYGFTELTKENGSKVGEDIGGKLANTCPAFLELLTQNPEATANLISGNKNSAGTLEGTFLKITKSDLSYIEIKTASGKIEKLYWLEYFEGSTDLISNPSKLNSKKVTVSYLEKEIYKAALNEYVKVKVITGLE